MASYHPDRAADLVLQSDSYESLLDDESCSDSYSQSDSIDGNSSDESSDPDVPTTSLAVRMPRGGGAIQPRARRNYVWTSTTRQPQLQSFTGNPDPTSLASITDIDHCLEQGSRTQCPRATRRPQDPFKEPAKHAPKIALVHTKANSFFSLVRR